MKSILLILSLIFCLNTNAQEITDFNSPLWDYGTGNGADASGSGVISGVPFTIDFHLNNGVKLFTEPPLVKANQHTSNATIGHGGPLGSPLLGGVDEGLTLNFASTVTVVLGFSHVNNSTDGWDFLTPADEVVSLHGDHELVASGSTISGFRQNSALGSATTIPNSISYFKWSNVTQVDIQIVGSAGTTLALSSMNVTTKVKLVPSLSTWAVLLLIGMLGIVGIQKTRDETS